jgi:phosphoenolpyruvate carboxylase
MRSRDKDEPLRRDVRSLGTLLGTVIREQEGDDFFETVEKIRKLAIAGRTGEISSTHDEILHRISTLDAAKLAKAFATYFELINLAETNHRKRRRHESELQSEEDNKPGAFRSKLMRLRDTGIPAETVLETLRRIEITPVFTAHPTEVARRTILWSRQRISRLLEKLDAASLPRRRAQRIERELAAEITVLWQSDEVRRSAPTYSTKSRWDMTTPRYSSTLFLNSTKC